MLRGRALARRCLCDGWPRPRSPEWLALQKRPFFGIPSDDEPPIWKQQQQKATPPPWVGAAKKEHETPPPPYTGYFEPAPETDAAPPPETEDRRGKKPWRHLARPPPTATPPDRWAPTSTAPVSKRLERMRAFSLTPKEIKGMLDARVVGQENAKRTVAVAVSEHFHHARRCLEDPDRGKRAWHKKNVLLFGPSGSGKTQLCRALADVVDAPYVKADATKYSATGYVGRDVEELVSQLVEGDAAAAEFGVIHVDEIDKVAEKTGGALGGASGSGSINTRDVQTALLKLMEDGEVPIAGPPVGGYAARAAAAAKDGSAAKNTFCTKHVLFVFSGAFEMLRGRPDDAEITAADLIGAGLIPEFVGRVPVRVALEALTADDLAAILAAESDVSPLVQSVDAFEAHGIALTYEPAALGALAESALERGLGARSLVSEVDAVLRDFAYELPGSGVAALHLDADVVGDPAAALRRILPGAS